MVDTRQQQMRSSSLLASAHKPALHILNNIKKPFLVYGTAWKEDKTATYVEQAIRSGFRFIDTAAQPKHYYEAGVGEGWKNAVASLKGEQIALDRSDLFLQTKFSPSAGQNPNDTPYDPSAPLDQQVQQSIKGSLKNLQTDYLDSLVLHSPLSTMEDTLTVWRAMEDFVDQGIVHRLGISNCYDYKYFTSLYDNVRIKPWVLQNRFYEDSNFDTQLRQFCKSHNIWYQSFWTLTANRHALATPQAYDLAQTKRVSTPQTLMFAFLLSLGYVTPLSGTTSLQHMKEDVEIMERFHNGEVFFHNEQELKDFAKLLGMPDL